MRTKKKPTTKRVQWCPGGMGGYARREVVDRGTFRCQCCGRRLRPMTEGFLDDHILVPPHKARLNSREILQWQVGR